MHESLEETIRSYGLAEVPASVRRISQIVAKQNAFIDEIAAVIKDDGELTARLLRAANPRANDPSQYTIRTIREALRRSGSGWVLLLAVSDPLLRAVVNAFRIMLNLEVVQVPVSQVAPLDEMHILCQVAFEGQVSGSVSMRLSIPLAQRLGGEFLGFGWQELTDPDALKDAMGELFNMVSGNFRSNLCHAQLPCRLLKPSITRTAVCQQHLENFSTIQCFAFRAAGAPIYVDLIVEPWGA